MGENSAIEWTDHTFNPWVGCTKISPACDNCYAEGWARRAGQAKLWQGERRQTSGAYWRQPLRWNREAEAAGARRRVFCASLADVFDNQVDGSDWREQLWRLIRVTPALDWLLLTKRPQNIRTRLPDDWGDGWANVWLGATVETQYEASRRIPHLMDVPAKVRFLSCEPLLGPLDLMRAPHASGGWDDWLTGYRHRGPTVWLAGRGLDWIICGGESGPGARPMHPDWATSLRDQCAQSGVPFFFKQWGDWAVFYDRDQEDPDWRRCPRCDDAGERYLNFAGGHGFHGERVVAVRRVGKKAAGAKLAGREHRAFPNV